MNEVYRDILFGAVFIVPALALSTRLALRPIVESIARLRESFAGGQDERTRALEAEVQALRAETRELRRELRELQGADSFYRQLGPGSGGGGGGGGGG